ncbi:type III-A CRISPR-associated RAMP protein Csm5 [Eubacterium sp. 1001713B170207_170306_E7]|uniref:type III-A CRISPR-associated RAMP protein Csm5 n=1 Tax=Eubacterium sp. 1001713B170207_170306_E7 TaxID=2787097 RepID=UPI001898C5A3|nr:type III-A CRISPR-associated RAMP protein Csm5 [Eubacterium sp. 1001713B170207_170306_E7]
MTATIKLKTVTPVFIGSGKSFTSNKDFMANSRGSNLNFVNQKKLEQWIYENKKSKTFSDYLAGKSALLYHWLNEQEIQQDEFLQIVGSRTVTANTDIGNARRIGSVAAFIRDAYGKPYIPGTSLKGAINNVLKCHFLINNDNKSDKVYFEEKRQEIINVFEENSDARGTKIKQTLTQIGDDLDAYLEQRFFSGFNTKSFLPSPVLISDSNHVEESQLEIYQKHDYILSENLDGKDNWLPFYRECLCEKIEFTFQARFDFDRITEIDNFEDLKNALRIQKQLLLDEDGIYSKFYDEIKKFIPPAIINRKSLIFLFLGGGTGFHTKTLLAALFNNDDAFQRVTHNILDMVKRRGEEDFAPHTIKLANDKMMGICKLELEVGDNA